MVKKPPTAVSITAGHTEDYLRRLVERLRQQVEAHHAQQHASRQSEDQVQPVAGPDRDRAAGQRRDHRHERQQDRHCTA